MPTYEYLCKCGHEFEEFQSITAKPVAKCPECGKQAKRQISAGAGLIFKGSGFYITDYKKSSGNSSTTESGSSAKSASSPEKTSSSSSDSGSGKSESKTSSSAAAA